MEPPLDFDTLARRYDAWYARPVGAWADRHETEAIFRLLALQPGEHLLDLGAGTGRHALIAAQAGAHVTAIDRSAEMLAIVNARLRDQKGAIVRADIERLPFPDESFDAALAVTVLCFAKDPVGVLTEARRVLRPGGRLVLGELNQWSLWAVLRRMEAQFRETTFRSARFHNVGELQRSIVEAGFHPVRWEGLLHLPPIDNAWLLQFLEPLEQAGRRWLAQTGAFLVFEATRPPAKQKGHDHER